MTPDAIYQLVYFGKNKMPGYGKDCAPKVRGSECLCYQVYPPVLILRNEYQSLHQGKCTFGPRLPDEEIKTLSDYVVDKAEQGWK